jgi:hypothetical protein
MNGGGSPEPLTNQAVVEAPPAPHGPAIRATLVFIALGPLVILAFTLQLPNVGPAARGER